MVVNCFSCQSYSIICGLNQYTCPQIRGNAEICVHPYFEVFFIYLKTMFFNWMAQLPLTFIFKVESVSSSVYTYICVTNTYTVSYIYGIYVCIIRNLYAYISSYCNPELRGVLPLQESRSEASLERRWIRSCESMMKKGSQDMMIVHDI